MSNFYTLLTRVGAALHANAQVNQTTVPWTHMRLGDGGGAPVVPTENQKGLVRQVHTLAITDIAIHPDNPNWVIAEAVVPSDVGGWTVRETAIYGGADGSTCIAVGNYPETYKPVLAEGAGREMVMRMVVQISSVATVKLEIDPAVAIASRAWVESLKATPQKAGLVKLADIPKTLEGERGDVAVTPQGLQAALEGTGGMPRFTPYVWGGRGDAMPEGDTQSSGQQLLDLMYPDMRADVMATQFYCTETEWQADPYKRVTHWSLGDGVSWMRPPDKNCVQPGSLEGPFFGGGVGSQSALLGTSVLDQMQGHWHETLDGNSSSSGQPTGPGQFSTRTQTNINTALILERTNVRGVISDGINGDPRIGTITRPRTWHGIWMIRMYGRVLNTGVMDAAGLNARMDMLDSRVSALEAGGARVDVTTLRVAEMAYTVDKKTQVDVVATASAANGWVRLQRLVGGSWRSVAASQASVGSGVISANATFLPGEAYKISLSSASISASISTVEEIVS